MQRKADYVNSELGEEMNLYKLIVMDDVSDLADKSNQSKLFNSFAKIWHVLRLHFSQNLSKQTTLEHDHVPNTHISFFPCFCS